MKTIYLVTGANGHLGSAVCAALHEKAADVRALAAEEKLSLEEAARFLGDTCRNLENFWDLLL